MRRPLALLIALTIALGSGLSQQPSPQPSGSTPPPASAPAKPLDNSHYYRNSDGQLVHSPAHSTSTPAGASAVCGDGTYSFSQHRQGTCSHHGGVRTWVKPN